jgi:Uncharacterized conserved protein
MRIYLCDKLLFIRVKIITGLLNAPVCRVVLARGHTREAALENIKEAIEGYITVLKQDGLSIPEEHFDTMLIAL